MTASKKTYRLRHTVIPRGFTLIELMIAILIIAILSAIGSLSYSSMRRQACVTIARYDLEKFFQAEQAYLTEYSSFIGKAGDIISNAPGITSTFSLPDYSPSKNTYITIIKDDPFTAEVRQVGIGLVFECDVRTGIITER